MQTGTVLCWDPVREFGYIEPDEGPDIEVRRTVGERALFLMPGRRVWFLLVRGQDGILCATNVQVIRPVRAPEEVQLTA